MNLLLIKIGISEIFLLLDRLFPLLWGARYYVLRKEEEIEPTA